jgi:hypothetical protein
MSLPPIVAKVTAETDQFVKGISNAETRLKTFAKVGAAAAVAVGTALIALTRRSMEQVDAQAKLAQSLGTTVASMQTLSRAGQLAGVSMGGIQQATSDLTRRLSQAAAGTGPAAAALDRLGLSARELALVPLDERVIKINEALDKFVPVTERAAVAGQLFGEEGSLAMARIDTATLRQATSDVHRFGVVVREQDADNIEAANDAVSRLGLVMEGLGNKIAAAAAPAVERLANGIANVTAAIFGLRTATVEVENYTNIIERFGNTKPVAAMTGSWSAFLELVKREDASEVISDLEYSYDSLFETVGRATSGMTGDIQDLISENAAMGMGFSNAADKVQALGIELQKAISEGRVEDAARLREELGKAIENLDMVIQGSEQLSGLDMSASKAWVDSLSGAFAILAQTATAAATAASAVMGVDYSALGDDERGSQREGRRDVGMMRSAEAVASRVTGVGGGGAVQNELATRLEALIEGLQTEAEVVAEWYAQSQMTLEEALAKRLITEQEYREQRERLEEEHQRRIQALREMGNQWGVEAALAGGAEILNAMGQTNQKALKVAKAFAAAEALVSTYKGAAKALEKGAFGFAEAAAVIAKGIGFVNAIKGASAGGGGAVGAGGTGAAASGPAGGGVSQNVAIQLVGGDMFNRSQVVTLINKINEAVEGGAKLRIV